MAVTTTAALTTAINTILGHDVGSPDPLSIIEEAHDGTTSRWLCVGDPSTVGRPAVINADGRKSWHQNGELHRVGGPALIYPNGYKEWYQNGLTHRVDGPAVIYADGTEALYENGQFIK